MFKVNKEKCIGCGACVRDCSFGIITLKDNKAEIPDAFCNRCAHCIAVCPVSAVESDQYDMSECIEKKDLKLGQDPQVVLDSLKFRRAIRHFKSTPIEKEKLDRIFEAARFAPTGGNSQDVRYVLVTAEKRMMLERMILDGLLEVANNIDKDPAASPRYKRYAQLWRQLDREFEAKNRNIDVFFFDSVCQIAIISKSDIDAGIAAQAMANQANAEGLGVLFNGFFKRGVDGNPKLAELLKIEADERMYTSICLGYPDVSYLRTVPRDKLKLTIF